MGNDGCVTVIGGGLAGCEAACQAVRMGLKAVIHEMKPEKFSPAHSLPTLSELVCSNSLKSEGLENASGLLKEEMRLLSSVILKAADMTRVPAGRTLAVDRTAFSEAVTEAVRATGVSVAGGEVVDIPSQRPLVIATGPLTSDAFAQAVQRLVGGPNLNFYDAVAPIVYADSMDMGKAFAASRYGKGAPDYINCPLSRDEYDRFLCALVEADRVAGRDFENIKYFEGCMPIEALAGRGPQTLLFGPMRPVGLVDPATGKRPYAAVQLRRENREGTLYNIVGFQTRMTFSEQRRVIRLIPGLERAEFARFGKLHRNSYIDSPALLHETLQLKRDDGIFFAGQITGVEGYCESAASGIIAGINAARSLRGLRGVCPPQATMTGALLRHITDSTNRPFSPMNANMGLLPHLPGKDRKEKQIKRAIEEFTFWRNEHLETLP